MRTVREGSATLKIGDGVFYNPKMSKLRDVSVIFLRAMGLKRAKLLDATAATGIRGIRYCLESGIADTTMLDINPKAYRNARSNARLNKIKAHVIGESLQEFAGSSHDAFDVIDIDPFGSPAPMVHDALKLSKDGTLMMITATDTATLCGAEGPACLRIYGSMPMHNELCHESSVRILLSFVAREAAQFNFGIEPLLSIADMHYVRVFLRLRRGAAQATESVKASGFAACCSRCHAFAFKKGIAQSVLEKCVNCGAEMRAYGPMWLGNLKDQGTVVGMLKESRAYPETSADFVRGLSDELDIQFFYSVSKITSYLKTGSVPMQQVIDALGKRHRVSRTQFDNYSLKTDASLREVIKAVKSARRASRE